MSQGLQRLIERATSDEAFAARLRADLGAAIAGYDLTDEEQAALRSCEAGRLRSVGVDVRSSKGYGKFVF